MIVGMTEDPPVTRYPVGVRQRGQPEGETFN